MCLSPQFFKNIPDLLRERAKRLVEGITEGKIMKSLVSALGLAADRFLNRAEAIDNWSTNLNVFAAIADEHGSAPSHSVSGLTIKETQKVEIVTEHDTASESGK